MSFLAVRVEILIDGASPDFSFIKGGECDDCHVSRCIVFSYGSCSLNAVAFGHRNIHDDDMRCPRECCGDRLPAAQGYMAFKILKTP